MRSFLFVPGDSDRKFQKAMPCGADALILDIEDSVASDSKPMAREATRAMLSTDRGDVKLYVRVNAFDSGMTLDDLAAVMPMRPDGIVLPKSSGGDDIRKLSDYLDAFEAAAGTPKGVTRIIAVATETAESLFGLGTYKDASPRLWGMMWGAEDLAASFGATNNRNNGVYSEPFRLARNLCLAGAAAAGVVAIDTVCTDISDVSTVTEESAAARRDGFGAKAVIHPNHIAPVNMAFTPSEEDIAWAERIVAAFASDPSAGVVKIDGKMIDKPHERQARKILGMAQA